MRQCRARCRGRGKWRSGCGRKCRERRSGRLRRCRYGGTCDRRWRGRCRGAAGGRCRGWRGSRRHRRRRRRQDRRGMGQRCHPPARHRRIHRRLGPVDNFSERGNARRRNRPPRAHRHPRERSGTGSLASHRRGQGNTARFLCAPWPGRRHPLLGSVVPALMAQPRAARSCSRAWCRPSSARGRRRERHRRSTRPRSIVRTTRSHAARRRRD